MKNFTTEQKQQLEVLAQSGKAIYGISYDPTVVTGTPEADALALGLIEFYREDSANLVEVIYTK